MSNILIVGGAGYIGSHVAKAIIKAGHKAIVFDNLLTSSKENVVAGADFIFGDLRNPSDIDGAMKQDIDAVIHLAALKAAGESMIAPEKYSVNNISGAINLLNAMAGNGVKKIIFSSSAVVYGDPQYLPVDEKHSTEPINYYGFTKLEIERLAKWYSQLKDIRFAALRYSNAVGYDHEGDVKNLERDPQNLLPIVMEVICGQRPLLQIFGDDYDTPDGTCIRDYIHVDDLASGHVKALEYLTRENKDITVNLSTGRGLSVKEIIDEAKKQSGIDFKVETGPRRPGDSTEFYADNHLAKELLDWEPHYSDIETIVKTTLKAYQSQ